MFFSAALSDIYRKIIKNVYNLRLILYNIDINTSKPFILYWKRVSQETSHLCPPHAPAMGSKKPSTFRTEKLRTFFIFLWFSQLFNTANWWQWPLLHGRVHPRHCHRPRNLPLGRSGADCKADLRDQVPMPLVHRSLPRR